MNVNGGTLNAVAITLGRGTWKYPTNGSTFNGTLNVSNGGVVNLASGDSFVAYGDRQARREQSTSVAAVSMSARRAAANLNVGVFNGTTGAVNVSGGDLKFDNNSNLRFSTNAGTSPTGTLTISGGNGTFYSNAGTTVGGTGVIDLMNTNATGNNTINLNGGMLTANQIKATNATGTRVINFNGGTLKSGASGLASTFLNANVATTANVRNGGAIIDTNGNIVTIGQVLTHSAIGGDNATDGGLTKLGAGTLTLSGANTYNGATTVNGGTLAITGSVSSTAFNVAAGATLSQTTFALTSGKTLTMSLDASTNGFLSTTTLNLGGALVLNFTTGSPAPLRLVFGNGEQQLQLGIAGGQLLGSSDELQRHLDLLEWQLQLQPRSSHGWVDDYGRARAARVRHCDRGPARRDGLHPPRATGSLRKAQASAASGKTGGCPFPLKTFIFHPKTSLPPCFEILFPRRAFLRSKCFAGGVLSIGLVLGSVPAHARRATRGPARRTRSGRLRRTGWAATCPEQATPPRSMAPVPTPRSISVAV